MKKRRIRFFFPVLLVVAIIACMSFIAACGDVVDKVLEDNKSDVTLTEDKFVDGSATVVVDGDRNILIVPLSEKVELTSTGAFIVKVGNADSVSSTDNKLVIDNTAASGTPMTVTVLTDKKLSIIFALKSDYTSDVILEPNDFDANNTASVKVEGDRKITIAPTSSDVEFTSTAAFSVKVGETVTNSTDNAVTIENTSDFQVRMTVTVHTDALLTITVKLKFDLGSEENPHAVSATAPTEIACGEEAWFNIAESGWYSFESASDATVTNYTFASGSKALYLAAGKYSLGSSSADATVTVTPVETAPAGYSSEDPASMYSNTGAKLKIYNGVKCVIEFTAPETALYQIALGTDGVSPNARFTTDRDAKDTYYGKYFDTTWKSYAAAKGVYALAEGETVTVTVDYTNTLTGNDDVSVSVAEVDTYTEITELDQNVTAELTAGGKTFYSFTATQRGKYSFHLANGETNAKCRYKIAGDDTVYTKDAPATRLIDADEKILLIVDSADATVSGNIALQVSQTLEEPFPATWKSGTFENVEADLSIDIDITNKQVVYNSRTVHLYYLDGVAEFTLDYGGNLGKEVWDLKLDSDGNYVLKRQGKAALASKEYVLTVPQPPVEIAKWTGVFASETGIDGDKKLTIYETGEGYIGTNIFTGYSAVYNRNIITWGSYKLAIETKSEDGAVTAVSVKKNDGEAVVFTKTNDAVVVLPDSLPLETNKKYMSADGVITIKDSDGYYQTLQTKDDEYESSMTIFGYDGSAEVKVYNVLCAGVKYTLKITLDANEKASQIVVCDADGKTLDTIALYEVPFVPVAFVADGTTQNEFGYEAGAVNDQYTFFKAPKSGWYKISAPCTIYVGATKDNPTEGSVVSLGVNGDEGILPTQSDYIYLEADELVSFQSIDGAFTATVTETAPKGFSASNPFVMVDGKYAFAQGMAYDFMTYYVSFTATEVATYDIRLDSAGKMTIGGTEYGKYYDADLWKNVNYPAGEAYTADFEAEQTVLIAVSGINPSSGPITISATKKAKELFTADQVGTYEGDDGAGTDAKLTINSDFTVDYELSINSGVISGIEVAFDGTKYTFSYSDSGVEYDVEFRFTESGISLMDGGEFTLVKKVELFTADQLGEYVGGDGEGTNVTLTINPDFTVDYYNNYNSGVISGIEVAFDGTKYTFAYTDSGYNGSVEFTFTDSGISLIDGGACTLEKKVDLFTANQLGEYAGDDGAGTSVKLTINSDFTVDYYNSYNSGVLSGIEVAFDGTKYTFSYTDSGYNGSVEFSFTDSGITLFDGGEFALTKDLFTPDQLGNYAYADAVEGFTITLSVSNNTEEMVYKDDWDNTYTKPTVTKDGDVYTANFVVTTITFHFDNDGNLILNNGMEYTLTKTER